MTEERVEISLHRQAHGSRTELEEIQDHRCVWRFGI